MANYIIKGAGTIEEICTALKTMQAVFGKDTRLIDIARFVKVKTSIEKQFNELKNENK